MKSYILPLVCGIVASFGYLSAQSISKEELQKRIAEKEAARYMPGTAAIAKAAITGPEQDCPNAIPVCTNVYHQPKQEKGTYFVRVQIGNELKTLLFLVQ